MDFTFIYSTAILFLMLMDPFGNLPVFMATLRNVPSQRKTWVIFREHCFALIAMLLSLIGGKIFFGLLQIDTDSLAIAGGLILMLTGIKMVFSSLSDELPQYGPEPFIVPLAIPLVCGPGLIAILCTIQDSAPGMTLLNCLCAVGLAWGIQTTIMLFGRPLSKALGPRGLNALESLMGLLLTALAISMILAGVNRIYGIGPKQDTPPPALEAPVSPDLTPSTK